jgi:hypothetical protein
LPDGHYHAVNGTQVVLGEPGLCVLARSRNLESGILILKYYLKGCNFVRPDPERLEYVPKDIVLAEGVEVDESEPSYARSA